MRTARSAIFALLPLGLDPSGFGQVAFTSLRGTVFEENGAVVHDAAVMLNDPTTGFSRTGHRSYQSKCCDQRHPHSRAKRGDRNIFRGPGTFDIDAGLSKMWRITENQSLKLIWEVFNVTNTPRFNLATMSLAGNTCLSSVTSFGNFTSTLSNGRGHGVCAALHLLIRSRADPPVSLLNRSDR
jgi:hypothetical protein